MVQMREQIAENDQWNVEKLYKTFDEWQSEFEKRYPETAEPRWPRLQEFKGKLGKSPTILKDCLEYTLETERIIKL